jgi:hypothetical protein
VGIFLEENATLLSAIAGCGKGPVSDEKLERHTAEAKAHVDLIAFLPGMNPRPTTQ